MPRITVKTNTFINREKKYRMTVEFKEAIEHIPCEKGAFVMADFEDELFMLFGDNASDPCVSIEVSIIDEVFEKYDRKIFEEVLARMTKTAMTYTQVPEDRIFALYKNSPLWTYHCQDIVGNLIKL